MIDGQIPHASGVVVTVTLLVSDALLRVPVTLECPVQLIAERVPPAFRGLFVMTLLGVDFRHDTFLDRCPDPGFREIWL